MNNSEVIPRDEILSLSARFIDDARKREQVLAILAFVEVLQDVPARVSEPLLGDIRYTWWIEALEEIGAGGKVRYHPLSEALKDLIHEHGLSPEAFIAAIEAYRGVLEGPLTMKEALIVADQGAAALMRQAARIVSPEADTVALTAPVRFYVLANLKAARLLKTDETGEAEHRHLRREAKAAMKTLPSALLPLAIPAALASDLWTGRKRGPLRLRLALLWAFVTGRF